MLRSCFFVVSLCVVVFPQTASAWAQVVLIADRDNTLYETEMDAGEVQNEFSNGVGNFLFAGRTNFEAGFRLRRGLIRFDLSSLPAGSEVLYAKLILYQSKAPPGAFPITISLHRVMEDWGEGASKGIVAEGQGAPAQPGDATWFHRFYDTATWTVPGGSFAASASASATVGATLIDYSWNCTSPLVNDVQSWLDNESTNFGWIINGGEEGAGTARRFNSSNNGQAETRPRLSVVYRPPGYIFVDGFESKAACE